MSPKGFSALEKNTAVRFQWAMHPIQSGVTAYLQIVMEVWFTFFEFELDGPAMAAHC
jgi:hypothetical protein